MQFHGREATQIENSTIRVTVLAEGGHIAEILHKKSGTNPLWIPPWKSIEPSQYDRTKHPEYGSDSEARLLAGIMGHNLCSDIFGPPSAEEEAAGLSAHGEASVVKYRISGGATELRATAELENAALRIERIVRLDSDGVHVRISESIESRLGIDRPIAWTQHVTLGPPFVQPGKTRVKIAAELSRTLDPPGWGDGILKPASEFRWPHAPRQEGGMTDLSIFSAETGSKFTAHLMDRSRTEVEFEAFHPETRLQFGYRWRRENFPWLGLWEENCFRRQPPWNARTQTWGLEFGVSPYPEARRQMVERSQMLGEPTYRWLPARTRLSVDYAAFIRQME